jgi:hypothetical protein
MKMTGKQNKIKQRISAIFLLLLTISTVLLAFPLIPRNSVNIVNDEDNNNKEGSILPVLSNGIGEDPWWNASYQWRQCINITNPGDYNLTDNIIKIQFNWRNLYDDGHLQDDLEDIRIVENDILRNYYIRKDFPSADLATVWFETNSTSGTNDYDTYMYYGNDTISIDTNFYMDNCPDGIARWEFEEGSGTMAYDSMNSYHGTLRNMNDLDFIQGVQGDYALDFDGSNDYIALNMCLNNPNPAYDDVNLDGSIYEFTASAWVKIGLNLGGWSILDFDRSEYFTFAAGTPGYRATDGHVEFDCAENGGGIDDYHGGILIDEDSAWHHCVITFDYTQQYDKKIYVDGVLDLPSRDSWSGNQYPIGDISETRFGFIGDGSEATGFDGSRNGHYFQGALDDVRYFDYALSQKEIDWFANYYPLDIDLLGEAERSATVTILVKDVDDRTVPGAEVSLWKNSTHILTVENTTYTQFTLSDGTVEFLKVPFGSYNISVNYTTTTGLYEEVVYDSRSGPGGEVEYKGLVVSTNVSADLWTIDFEVDDWDGDPLNYGYVNVSAESAQVVDSLILDWNGTATFRWLNRTSYNYTVYYDNVDYAIYQNPTSLNSSIITRGGAPMIYQEVIQTEMSKLGIQVMDSTGTEGVTGVKVKVQLNNTSTDVVELETDTSGYAYGDLTKDFGFWYIMPQAYNFSLWIIDEIQIFSVNTSDKYKPALTDYYNYTLDQASMLVFFLDGLNFTQRIANFTSEYSTPAVTWGENMSFSIMYETSNDSGTNWVPDWNAHAGNYPTSALWTIYTKFGEKLLEIPMGWGATTGNFTLSVNSTFLSAGDDSEYYYAIVKGYKPFWNDPGEAFFGITIYAKPTSVSLHNYTTMNELPENIGGDYEISEYHGFALNITAKFFDSTTNSTLSPEFFSYDWDYGSGILISDPLHTGFYYFELDTALATNVGKYRIDITVGRENFSMIEDFALYINIISRPTTINGSSGLLYISENIIIFEEQFFVFEYEDVFSSTPISNLDEKSYLLQKIDPNGDPIPGTTEVGELIETVGNKYILDLDTETRLDGEYSIIVTLDKLNYEHRIAIISLTIRKRTLAIAWPDKFSGGAEAKKIGIGSGSSLNFTVTITDPDNSSAPVIGADVYLTIKGTRYDFWDLGDGSYSIKTSKIADAFFIPSTISATLFVEKQYFSNSTTPITIVVNMHETFGIPTFYLLMIVGAIVAVTASLAIYRTIQQARIPTFVKKAKKMKKDIKGKKSISDSLLYPSKEEYMVKRLGDRWEMLGLSLQNVLGIGGKKKKSLPETPGEFKEPKGGVD